MSNEKSEQPDRLKCSKCGNEYQVLIDAVVLSFSSAHVLAADQGANVTPTVNAEKVPIFIVTYMKDVAPEQKKRAVDLSWDGVRQMGARLLSGSQVIWVCKACSNENTLSPRSSSGPKTDSSNKPSQAPTDWRSVMFKISKTQTKRSAKKYVGKWIEYSRGQFISGDFLSYMLSGRATFSEKAGVTALETCFQATEPGLVDNLVEKVVGVFSINDYERRVTDVVNSSLHRMNDAEQTERMLASIWQDNPELFRAGRTIFAAIARTLTSSRKSLIDEFVTDAKKMALRTYRAKHGFCKRCGGKLPFLLRPLGRHIKCKETYSEIWSSSKADDW